MTKVRMRVLGLVAVAALTASAVAASSASALPEWGNCIVQAQHEGRYTDSNCTSKAKKVSEKFTGEFEFVHIPGRTFNSFREASGGPVAWQSQVHRCAPSEENLPKCREGETEEVVPIPIECPNSFLQGTVSATNPKGMTSGYYEGFRCMALGSLPCGDASEAGILFTNRLKGTLGYIDKATKEVGLELKPEIGKTFFKAECGGVLSITMGEAAEKEGPAYPPKGAGDGVIAIVTPVNEVIENLKLTLTANGETAENVPSHFEGKGLALLEDNFVNLAVTGKGSKWSPAAAAGSWGVTESGVGGCGGPCPWEVKA